MPGKTNLAADATSRHPSPDIITGTPSHGDIAEGLTVASICRETTDITSISWSNIVEETSKDTVLTELKNAIYEGFCGTYPLISDYMRYKDSFFVQDDAVMYQDRVVIPKALRKVVLDTLHAAHQGASSMQLRAQTIVFWPGMTRDIAMKRAACEDCNRNAPSQAVMPSEPAAAPSLPFQQIVVDFFDFGGRHYLVAADRLSGFSEVFLTPAGTSHAGARGLVACLRKWFETFGVPEQVSSDGGPEFTADFTQSFLKKWGVSHRISSAYNPQSNGRAEVAVKTVKRLMRSNTGVSGSLDTDRFLRAMLQLRNTPDPDCGISPSEIVFGRQLRDSLSFASYGKRSTYSKRWQEAWAIKEDALRARFIKTTERINQHSRDLPPLEPGTRCFLQDQTGNSKKRWHCTGVVLEVQPHDKYVVKVDGTGRVTTRNRRFLRMYKPYSTERPFLLPDASDHDPLNNHSHTLPRPEADEAPVVDVDRTPDVLPDASKDQTLLPVVNEQPSPAETCPRTLPNKSVPLAVRRLDPHNQPGLKEGPLSGRGERSRIRSRLVF